MFAFVDERRVQVPRGRHRGENGGEKRLSLRGRGAETQRRQTSVLCVSVPLRHVVPLRPSIELPNPEPVLVLRHIHALADEANAFELEARALLEAGFELQLDLPSGADHALPG